MPANARKRPIRTLEPEEKLKAIQRVHAGERKASVARDIGVPESTFRGWCKNEEKIDYLSRQSNTYNSFYHQKKRRILDESSSMQPFTPRLKSKEASPNSETCYAPDYVKNGDLTKTHLSINMKNETPKTANEMSKREKDRVELAHGRMEPGLRRAKLFLQTMNDMANQWKSNQSRVPTTTDASLQSTSAAASVMNPYQHTHLPKEMQSIESWLTTRAQQYMLAFTQGYLPNVRNVNGFSASSTSPVTNSNGLKGTRPYQRSSIHFQPPFQALPTNNQQILLQHLSKDTSSKDERNASNENAPRYNNLEKFNNKTVTSTCNNKARSVLDNLFFNNENVDPDTPKECDILSKAKALKLGEMLLKWVETCNNPKITAMEIMQFRELLDNVRPEADDMPKRS